MPAGLALLASLLWGTADFLGGTASRRLPVASVLAVAQLVALLGLLPWRWRSGRSTSRRATCCPASVRGWRASSGWPPSTGRWPSARWASSRRWPLWASSCRSVQACSAASRRPTWQVAGILAR
jgi:hypothetical protein